MEYEYSGHLRHVMANVSPEAPSEEELAALPGVTFTAEDIDRWNLSDDPAEPVWRNIPVHKTLTSEGVKLEGHFEDVRGIDSLGTDDAPSFWVPLSTRDWEDERLPVDVGQYPIAEITYRCVSGNARPAWLWEYEGGAHFDGLRPTDEWVTVIRQAGHFGFPCQVDRVTVRLFATSRATEGVVVKQVRFRAMTKAEAEACAADVAVMEREAPPKNYPILDEFLPIGCHLDAGSAKRLAAMLGITLSEYWELVFEDFVKHHHNCAAVGRFERLTHDEWRSLLDLAASFAVKLLVVHEIPPDAAPEFGENLVKAHVAPFADAEAVFAWCFSHDVQERGYRDLMRIKPLVEAADSTHPMAALMGKPNGLPLFGHSLPACGVAHYKSHAPWSIGELVRTHLPLCRGQQFWVMAPAFIHATDTPEWHTSPEMRLMANLAFGNGAKGLFSHSYHNDPIWIRGSCQRSLTGPFLTFSDLWSELGQRMKQFAALAPLFLQSAPSESWHDWFSAEGVAHTNAQLPAGVPPASPFCLRGPDFDLCCVVSNDMREMTTVHLDIPPSALDGKELYDLSEFVRQKRWEPLPNARQMEMFPGQLDIMIAAEPEVCEHWRAVVARRLIDDELRQLSFDLALVRAYGLNAGPVEKIMHGIEESDRLSDLETILQAEDILLNLIYSSPAIYETRSKIIEASAAICACDGTLCRLQKRGKAEQARQLGYQVIPFAREFTHMRLGLRRGEGASVLEPCRQLAERARKLLAEIRAASPQH